MSRCAAGALRARRIGGWLVVIALVWLGTAAVAPAASTASPAWVVNGGLSSRHPTERWVTGHGQARGRDAEARARQAAVVALAQAVEVRVEFVLEDDRRGAGDRYDERVAALTRTSSEIELHDVRFEIWRGPRRVHALALLERSPAGRQRRRQRDRALARTVACLADADLSRETGDVMGAERRLSACRASHAQAIRHDRVSAALDPRRRSEDDALERLERLGAQLEGAERAAENAPISSLAEAADQIAAQLVAQGLPRPRRLDLRPIADVGTDLPSPFGQAAVIEIERALVKIWNSGGSRRQDPRRIVLGGSHRETADGVRLSLIAREFATGTLLASAVVTLPRDALPPGLALLPDNWKPALEQRGKLTPVAAAVFTNDQPIADPVARAQPSPLRVELWTDRGRERVSYTQGESIHVFMRVSGPAWVRLVYVLSNGLTVPIEDAFQIDAERAHTAIEYPGRLEVVAPFGVEMLHASAFAQRPPPLPTHRVELAGEPYDVVREGVEALVRERGIRLQRGQHVAEDVVTVTTLATATGSEWRIRAGD